MADAKSDGQAAPAGDEPEIAADGFLRDPDIADIVSLLDADEDASPGEIQPEDEPEADTPPEEPEEEAAEPVEESEEESEEPEETDEEAEEDEEPEEPLEDESPAEHAERKAWPKDVQAAFDRRIGKLVGKRNDAERVAQEATARAEAAEARSEQLDINQAAQQFNLPEVFLTEDAKDIQKREQELIGFLDFAERHMVSGYFKTDTESGEEIEVSPEELRAAHTRRQRELLTVIPRAKQILQARGQADTLARASYPQLFKKTSEEYSLMQALLTQAPYLRMFPNYRLLVGDMIEGQRARSEKAKAPKAKAKIPPKAPRVQPKRNASASSVQKRHANARGAETIVNHQSLAASGYSTDAVAEMLD